MTATNPDRDAAVVGEGDPIYAFKPSLVGAASIFRLGPDALHWEIGGRSGRVRYDQIRRVRLSYRPVTMQSHRFLTEIWAEDSPKIQIASVSWRSLVEQQRLDGGYAAFITELHRRLAAAGAQAQFIAGAPAPIYWLGVVAFAAIMVAMAVVVGRAIEAGQWTGAAIVGLFFLVFAFQLGNYFRRNRPGQYRPDALPVAALPRG
jgi:hypothetical protein